MQTNFVDLEYPAKKNRGETFNICSGKAANLQEVLEWIAAIVGYCIRVMVTPVFVCEN